LGTGSANGSNSTPGKKSIFDHCARDESMNVWVPDTASP
jgi:hypothetical protein